MWAKAGFGGHELAAAMLSFYRAEVEFYRDAAAALELGLRRCHYAGLDPDGGEALVLLEDLLARNTTFCVAGTAASPELVAAALDFLARAHARTWITPEHPERAELPAYPGDLRAVLLQVLGDEHWGKSVAKPRGRHLYEPLHDASTMRRAITALWDWDAERAVCRVHGDAHLGNLYRDRDGSPGFLDWQMTGLGHWAFDVAYFVANALLPADRRDNDCTVIERHSTAVRDLDALTLLLG